MSQNTTLHIPRVTDFSVDGSGSASQWENASWVKLPLRHGEGRDMLTQAKVLYSETGIYFLIQCEDNKLSATLTEDFANLFNEDVVEVFLWTEEEKPIYFEYELSPLDYELPILIPRTNEDFYGWRPWHYEGNRRTRHGTSVKGGPKESLAEVEEWTAEFFIPYALLKPLGNIPPKKGTQWRANMYRIDYDSGKPLYWQWQPTSGSFHEYKKFGTFIFD
ncbi:carbohydrate-binding family 9-like protein [Catalinimonas sp. 4WD22]|uniref:carbohydrate-binding family 9-like protein n=1 Tax=Catalinimonas locisalis TaxID=3133978 RepID=UPI003100F810